MTDVVEKLAATATSLLKRQQPPHLVRGSAPGSWQLPGSWQRAGGAAFCPHVIHQTWRDASLPKGFRRLSRTWQKHMPRWRYRLHTDKDVLDLVQQKYVWLLPAYRRFSSIQRADLARYLFLHSEGGVYADLDVELLKPLGTLLRAARVQNASVLIGQEPLAHAVLLEGRRRQVCNAVLVSARGHPFWLDVLRRVASGGAHADPVSSTGPRMLEAAVKAWQAKRQAREPKASGSGAVVVVPPDTFFPTWDPMQAVSFRQRCEGRAWATRNKELAAASASVCAKLRADKFLPTVPTDGSAFTNHLWAHTWIPGAQKRGVIDQ